MNPLTFGSLFAGIGGFDLGFERAGMVCKWQVEIDNYATKVLEKHWPGVHRERDIKDCGKHNLESVDVICGGFPCQDISYAGLGAGLDGQRSGLFFEAIRVVRELQPRCVVLENVAALLTRGLDRVFGTLASIGFDAEWHCIPAAAVGAPHIRDRVFIVGVRCVAKYSDSNKDRSIKKCAKLKSDVTTCGNCSRQDSDETLANAESIRLEGQRTTKQQIRSARSLKGKLERIRSSRGTVHWSTEPDVGRVAHGVSHRVDRLRGLGNAVVPQVAEFVGRLVIESLIIRNDAGEMVTK